MIEQEQESMVLGIQPIFCLFVFYVCVFAVFESDISVILMLVSVLRFSGCRLFASAKLKDPSFRSRNEVWYVLFSGVFLRMV